MRVFLTGFNCRFILFLPRSKWQQVFSDPLDSSEYFWNISQILVLDSQDSSSDQFSKSLYQAAMDEYKGYNCHFLFIDDSTLPRLLKTQVNITIDEVWADPILPHISNSCSFRKLRLWLLHLTERYVIQSRNILCQDLNYGRRSDLF